ncbi:hypothetical protein EI94DRAFT_1708747 [Lactarius quietus]|nr:hypothetical protein EI94DRAFT_1708747 [Lactarius quietus]
MVMNLHSPPEGAFWGQFNDRPLDKGAIQWPVNSYHENIQNCTDNTSIDIAVKKGWLMDMKNFKMTVKGPKIEDVPELKLLVISMAAVKNKNVDDGRASLVQGTAVVGQKEKEIKKMEKAVKNMEKVSMNEKGEGEWKKAMKVIAKERKKLETAKMWVVPVTEHGPSQDGESKQEVGEEENSMIILDKFNENWQVKQLLAHSLVLVSWIWHHYMHADMEILETIGNSETLALSQSVIKKVHKDCISNNMTQED